MQLERVKLQDDVERRRGGVVRPVATGQDDLAAPRDLPGRQLQHAWRLEVGTERSEARRRGGLKVARTGAVERGARAIGPTGEAATGFAHGAPSDAAVAVARSLVDNQLPRAPIVRDVCFL